VNRKSLTVLIYLLAAASTSAYLLPNNSQAQMWFTILPFWVGFIVPALLFAFAYPRLLFAPSAKQKHQRNAVILNALGAMSTIFLFPRLAAIPYPDNSVRDVDSLVVLIVPLIVLPIFLVAALSLMLKDRSTLAILASVLIWPYFFLLALRTLNRTVYDSPLPMTFYFFFFLCPALFAFAAGAVRYRPTIAHAMMALAGVLSLLWMFWSDLRYVELENPWIRSISRIEKFVCIYNFMPHSASSLSRSPCSPQLLPSSVCLRLAGSSTNPLFPSAPGLPSPRVFSFSSSGSLNR
jgi:hypothetical protein